MQKLEIKQMRSYIIDIIIDKIMSKKLKDGDKLTQQSIAEETGLSRMPVREALQLLEQKGFIRFLPNRHVAVIGATKNTISSAFKVLSSIEAEIATLLFEENFLNTSTLNDIIKQMQQANLSHDNKELAALELNFHLELIKLLKNPYLENIQTKFLNGYFKYGINSFPRNFSHIITPLQKITSSLENKTKLNFKKTFDEYYNNLIITMIEGGNYE